MGRDDGGSRTRARLVRIAVENWSPGTVAFGDDIDATFKTEFDAPLNGMLRFEGIATLATISVDGAVVANSRSMWVPVEVPLARGQHRIEVHCRALAPELEVPRKPRSRWRQKVAGHNNLRWFRTTLNGRAPGFAPGPPVVGLWRPVWFASGEVSFDVRTRLDGDEGVVTLSTGLSDGTRIRIGDASAIVAGGRAELRLSSPTLWWPHTHGEPHLYDLSVEGHDIRRRIGFRTLASPGDILRDGLQPKINGVDIFVRGALWTSVPEGQMRSTLETARDHGLNAVRIPGTMTYETAEFHDLCDEFGILVWQDLMFANMDYPFDDPDFRTLVGEELDFGNPRHRGPAKHLLHLRRVGDRAAGRDARARSGDRTTAVLHRRGSGGFGGGRGGRTLRPIGAVRRRPAAASLAGSVELVWRRGLSQTI